MIGENNNIVKDAVPIIYDIRNNKWTTQFKRFTGADATGPTNPSMSAVVPNMAVIGGSIAGTVVVVVLVGFFFHRKRVTIRKRTTDNKSEGTVVGLNVRGPQNPGGGPEAELLKLLSLSSPSPISPRPLYYDCEEFFRRLAASPLAGPHASMRDPQGEQQNRLTSGDEDKSETPSTGSYHQQSPPFISPRSPHMVYRGTSIVQDWPWNSHDDDDDDDDNIDHQSCEIAQTPTPSPPSPPTPRSPNTDFIDEQVGASRGPQWHQPLLPIVFLDHSQYEERSNELKFMMDAIKVEQEALARRKLVQDVLVAQMRAVNPYPPPPQPSPDPHQ